MIGGAVLVAALSVVLLFMSILGSVSRFRDQVILPNGMVLVRSFDWSRSGRDDLLATDGVSALARDIEGVCFNDRYIWVLSYRPEDTGLYDAEIDARLDSVGYPDAMAISGLSEGNGCNGYYTGMVGPGLLYDGNALPFLHPCGWQNLDNPALTHRDWFERPCDPDSR